MFNDGKFYFRKDMRDMGIFYLGGWAYKDEKGELWIYNGKSRGHSPLHQKTVDWRFQIVLSAILTGLWLKSCLA